MRPEERASPRPIVDSSTPSPEAHGTRAPELGECRLFNSLLGHSVESIVEPEDRHLAQIQFVVSAQYAFVVHKDDEPFGQRNS